jgi:hypothetical protein
VRAFDIAHVSASMLTGFVSVQMISNEGEWGLVAVCTLAAGAGAGIAGIVCRWWPGLGASWWRLWLAAWLFNPLVLFVWGLVLYQYECLLGMTRGWDCMALALVVIASPVTLIGPTVAVIVNAIARTGHQPAPSSH